MPRRQHPPSGSGDRNIRVLRAHHHTQFVERVRAGLVQPQDRFGKLLEVGDLIMWHPSFDPCCQIIDIEACPLNRQHPEESTGVYLTLGIQVREAVDVRHPAVMFAKVGHVEAPTLPAGSSNSDAPSDAPPTDDSPSDDSSDPSS